MSHDIPVQAESLLLHGPRLRALARRLVRDDARADDLVQETWVRALERGPAGEGSPKRWLSTVLRHLAFQDRRLEAHRSQRERAVARQEATREHEERFSGHKELVAAIDRLAEPYRQAILLRYFDDLPPRRIAATLGIPVKTVKTRLSRGLALLREDLDRRHGGREQWLAAMVPMLKLGTGAPGFIGGVSAGTAVKAAAAIVLVSGGAYLALSSRSGRSAEPGEPAQVVAGTRASVPLVELASPPEPETLETRAPIGAAPAASAPAVPAPVLGLSPGIRHGRVLDPDGIGLAGVWVGFEPGTEGAPEPVMSGADGGFELPELDCEAAVVSRDERFATVLASLLDPRQARPEDEHVLVVAPSVSLGGTVRDECGQPVAAARLRIEVSLSFRGRFREVLDRSIAPEWRATADDQGRFLLEGAPGLASARLVAWSGPLSAERSAPERDDLALEIVLTSSGSSPSMGSVLVVGEVRHAGGGLAPRALVSAGGVSTRADDEALFELRIPPLDAAMPRSLIAVVRGEQAAVFTPPLDSNGAELWPPFVSLWLGEAPKSISGRVLGTDGQPLAGAPVWAEDLTFVGKTHDGFLTLEHEMTGKTDQWTDRWLHVRADDQGRFELGCLCDRAYGIAALDPATGLVGKLESVAAGSSDVVVALSPAGLWDHVAGRMVDSHGQPLAGVQVQALRETFGVRSFQGALWHGSEPVDQPVALTDADGRFVFGPLSKEGVILEMWGGTFNGLQRELRPDEDPQEILVVVPWLGHVQVELEGTAPPGGRIELLDHGGRAVEFYVFGGGDVWTRGSIHLDQEQEFAGGRTPVLSVPDSATAVVLRDALGNELRRVPLVLAEGLTSVTL